jgi:S-formylglutathione hydrolase FrmB
MFLLHGYSDDHTIWGRRTSIERYVEGLPLVVVMPDGGHGFYTDAEAGYSFGTAIGVELPDLIRHYFPVTEAKWAITGLSMGGYGAFRLALAYPDTFGSAVSHSGAMAYGHRGDHFDPSRLAEYHRIVGTDPKGSKHDLFHLAALRHAEGNLPALRFDCGFDDFLLDDNRQFKAFLNEARIPHEYQEFPGDHNWAYWDEHVQEAIAFHLKSL